MYNKYAKVRGWNCTSCDRRYMVKSGSGSFYIPPCPRCNARQPQPEINYK